MDFTDTITTEYLTMGSSTYKSYPLGIPVYSVCGFAVVNSVILLWSFIYIAWLIYAEPGVSNTSYPEIDTASRLSANDQHFAAGENVARIAAHTRIYMVGNVLAIRRTNEREALELI
jgi:hypothetical protein